MIYNTTKTCFKCIKKTKQKKLDYERFLYFFIRPALS